MSEIVEQNQMRGVSEDALRESGKEIMNVASRSAKDRLKASFILTRIGEAEKDRGERAGIEAPGGIAGGATWDVLRESDVGVGQKRSNSPADRRDPGRQGP